jgi:hypothetical protein
MYIYINPPARKGEEGPAEKCAKNNEPSVIKRLASKFFQQKWLSRVDVRTIRRCILAAVQLEHAF